MFRIIRRCFQTQNQPEPSVVLLELLENESRIRLVFKDIIGLLKNLFDIHKILFVIFRMMILNVLDSFISYDHFIRRDVHCDTRINPSINPS